MKITPLEIRQHTFEKAMRGYRPDEVDAFLASLSQEWERVTSDHKMMKMQLELAEKELAKLREVEMTLFRTLKNAEDSSQQITEQANKAAEQYLTESRQKADALVTEARKRSAMMVQDAENQARHLKETITNDIKSIEEDFKAMERYKEALAKQVRALAEGAIENVERFEKRFAKQSLTDKVEDLSAKATGQAESAYAAATAQLPANAEDPELPTAEAETPTTETQLSENNVAAETERAPEAATDQSASVVAPDTAPDVVAETPAENATAPAEPSAETETVAEVEAVEQPPVARPHSNKIHLEITNPEALPQTDAEPVGADTSAEAAPKKKGGSFFDNF